MAGSGDAMNPPLSKQKESSGGTKNRLKVTGKRLPWLNNKASAATPNKTMMQRASVDGPAPAPQGNPYSPSLGTQAVRPPSSPFQHRRSMASPTKRRVPSSGASPSPTPRKLSQASRKPSFRPISPLTEEGSVIRSTASTNGPNDTISDPPMTRPVQEFVQEAPPRKGSLAPVPGHLEEPSPSPTRDRRSSRRVSIISGGHGVSVTSLSEPALTFGEPVPRRASLAPVPAHLEEPSSSPESSDSNLNVLLPEVFRSAEVHPQQPVPKRHSFESGRDRQLSNAIEGLEGLVQEAVDIADENANPDQVREVFGIIEDAALAVREASAIPAQDLMATTSPLKVSSPEDAPVENQRGSEAIDWAYKGSQNSGQQPPSLSSSSSDDSVWRRRSKIDYRSDQETLLPPKSIHSTGREHTDYVQRPGRNRSHSRGRSRLRRAGGSDADARRDRRHRSFRRYLDADSIDGKSRYPNNNTVPYEEEEEMDPPRPHKEKQRKYELSVRDQAHHHTFSLLRHHRRQPIARNWGTAKKRLTAAIACFNTALIGIIAGIYVSRG